MAANRKSVAAEPAKTEFSIIPHDKLKALYASLLKCELISAKQRGRKVDDEWEAVVAAGAGVLLDLSAEDVVIAGAKSAVLDALMPPSPRKRGRTPKPVQQVPEARLLGLIGKALVIKTQKNGRVAIAFWPDANEQPWLDALEIAQAHSLPIIFVCPPLSEEAVAQLAKTAGKPGTELPRITVDGHDPVAVYRVAHESIERSRRNRGATLIECARFRVPGVRGQVDPVANMERYLKAKGFFSRALQRDAAEQAARELQAAKPGR